MRLGQHKAPLFLIQHDRQYSPHETMQFLSQGRFVTSMAHLPEMNLKKEQALLAKEYARHFYPITKAKRTDHYNSSSASCCHCC